MIEAIFILEPFWLILCALESAEKVAPRISKATLSKNLTLLLSPLGRHLTTVLFTCILQRKIKGHEPFPIFLAPCPRALPVFLDFLHG